VLAVAPQQSQTDEVGDQGQQAHGAHRLDAWRQPARQLQRHLHEDPHAEGRHDQPLQEGGPGLPHRAPADRVEAEAVDDGVAQHVDRVGEQRRRARGQTGSALEQEHRGVDPERDVQHAALAGGNRSDFAARIHGFPTVLPCRPMTDKPIRVGFVGAGANTRKHHIPKIAAQAGVQLVSVANRTKESSERVAKEFGIARAHGDWREVVEAKDVDAVRIGTWPYMHAEMTTAALAAGKHVMCEARMAMNATEGRRMLEASRKAPQLIAQLVPAPHTLEVDRTLKQLIAEGYAGTLHAVEVQGTQQARFAEQGDSLHWRQNIALSGNNILNMGIWYEAMMRWLGPAGRG